MQHGRYIDMELLENADENLNKDHVREEERKIIKRAMFQMETTFFPFLYADWTNQQL